jgi:hypothetical protein
MNMHKLTQEQSIVASLLGFHRPHPNCAGFLNNWDDADRAGYFKGALVMGDYLAGYLRFIQENIGKGTVREAQPRDATSDLLAFAEKFVAATLEETGNPALLLRVLNNEASAIIAKAKGQA